MTSYDVTGWVYTTPQYPGTYPPSWRVSMTYRLNALLTVGGDCGTLCVHKHIFGHPFSPPLLLILFRNLYPMFTCIPHILYLQVSDTDPLVSFGYHKGCKVN